MPTVDSPTILAAPKNPLNKFKKTPVGGECSWVYLLFMHWNDDFPTLENPEKTENSLENNKTCYEHIVKTLENHLAILENPQKTPRNQLRVCRYLSAFATAIETKPSCCAKLRHWETVEPKPKRNGGAYSLHHVHTLFHHGFYKSIFYS